MAHKKGLSAMEKIISGMAVILVILFFTCPTEEDHQKAVDDKVSEFFEKGLSENPDSALGAALYMGILGAAANEVGIRPFEVHGYKNWWILSTAKIENDTTFGILDHVFIIDNSSKKKTVSPQSASPAKTSKYSGKRKYIKEFIDEHDGCRIATITKKAGDVAISGNNAYICTGAYPRGLGKALHEINDACHKINDVCLTEAGKWVVIYGGNGIRKNGIPDAMYDALVKFHDNGEEIYCASLNDVGDWVVISDKNYKTSSVKLMDWLSNVQREYGKLLYVSLTDDAKIAVFDGGYSYVGNYPKDMREAIKRSDFNPKVVKMAGDSWFFADETGRNVDYSM